MYRNGLTATPSSRCTQWQAAHLCCALHVLIYPFHAHVRLNNSFGACTADNACTMCSIRSTHCIRHVPLIAIARADMQTVLPREFAAYTVSFKRAVHQTNQLAAARSHILKCSPHGILNASSTCRCLLFCSASELVA